jgi:hypothetical protein
LCSSQPPWEIRHSVEATARGEGAPFYTAFHPHTTHAEEVAARRDKVLHCVAVHRLVPQHRIVGVGTPKEEAAAQPEGVGTPHIAEAAARQEGEGAPPCFGAAEAAAQVKKKARPGEDKVCSGGRLHGAGEPQTFRKFGASGGTKLPRIFFQAFLRDTRRTAGAFPLTTGHVCAVGVTVGL